MRKFEIDVELRLTITVNDEDVIDRVVNNHDDHGVPQPLGSGRGWRDTLYNLTDAEDVMEMLAYNYVVNDRVAHQLDGWADIQPNFMNPYIEYDLDRDTFHMDIREIEPSDV